MSAAAPSPQTAPPAMAKLLILAAVLGILAAAAGSVFLELVHLGESFFFTDLPEALGMSSAPWWWAALMLLIGASGVALARRMPGAAGKGPLTGFHFDNALRIVPSILVAALATLMFGFVLGPEAPLIVLGTAVGAIATRKADPQAQKVAMLLGGVAAIGAVFGNPFITAFMILEFSAFGLVPAMILPAVFVALGAGYLTQIGILGLPGFGVHTLSVPGLPPYDQIEPGHVVFGLIVALISAVVLVIVREGAVAIDRAAQRRPVALLFAAAVVTAGVLLVAQVGFDVPADLVLFSGQSGMPGLIAQTSITVVIVVVITKAIAYMVALGGGFRGGPIFPATFLGVGVGLLFSLVVPDAPVSPMAAAGIAAAAAAMIKLPGTSALLGALLISGSGAAIAPFAIFGAIVGLVVRTVADKRLGITQAPEATTPNDPTGQVQPA